MSLHELFALSRPLVIFDLETTGVNKRAARIIEIGFQYFTAKGLERSWRSLVNPECEIPAKITEITGISNADVTLHCWKCRRPAETHGVESDHAWIAVPKFRDFAQSLVKGFTNCDFGGKNIRFDLEILFNEMIRVSVEWSYTGANILDADRIESLGEPRTLSVLYEKYTGKKLDGAHSALIDVEATITVLLAQFSKFKDLPHDLAKLHELSWPGWIDAEGKFRYNQDGIPSVRFGKYIDEPMRRVPPDYWRYILREKFSPEIKRIAQECLEGRYPPNKEPK